MKKEPLFVTVLLDEPRRIRFSNAAICRMSEFDKPYSLADLTRPKKAMGALYGWLFACLYEPHPFETYLDLSNVIPMERVSELRDSLVQAINMASPSNTKADEAKNESAEKSPTPASNSA